MTWTLLLLAIEAVAITAAAHQPKPHALAVVLLLNMLLITVFGGQLVETFGLVSNAGNVWYAAVLAAQYVVLRRFGVDAAFSLVAHVFAALLLWLAVTAVLDEMPVVAGNEKLRAAYDLVHGASMRITAASFLAFACGQALFLSLYKRAEARGVVAYVMAMAVTQVVDTALFFSIAFGHLPQVWQMAGVGLAVKLACGVLLAPVVVLAIWMARMDESEKTT